MRISTHDEEDAGQGRVTVTVTTPSQVRALKHSIVMLLPGICACLVLPPSFALHFSPTPLASPCGRTSNHLRDKEEGRGGGCWLAPSSRN